METFAGELEKFVYSGKKTKVAVTPAVFEDGTKVEVPTFVNEFWTSRQRAAHSLHEISYRACFKPQLPRFFIERLTSPGDTVYDPFMGRGTTLLEAGLLGRKPAGCDINPLSAVLLEPRLQPPALHDIEERLAAIDIEHPTAMRKDLRVFYHERTLKQICGLREYLLERETSGAIDAVDKWIRMVAVNRLTGHSSGFFSVYTMPPNQAVSMEAQKKINAGRKQKPPERDVKRIILRKSASLLAGCHAHPVEHLRDIARCAMLLTGPADNTPRLATGSVDLVVTSPPFLNVVDYAGDNWLRCWFCGINPESVEITIARRVDEWQARMTSVFRELHRVVKPGGHVAFEVGEVRGGKVRLEEAVIPAAHAAGFSPALVLINAQQFTKTANCWGVHNNAKGTNTNRIVLLTP